MSRGSRGRREGRMVRLDGGAARAKGSERSGRVEGAEMAETAGKGSSEVRYGRQSRQGKRDRGRIEA